MRIQTAGEIEIEQNDGFDNAWCEAIESDDDDLFEALLEDDSMYIPLRPLRSYKVILKVMEIEEGKPGE